MQQTCRILKPAVDLYFVDLKLPFPTSTLLAKLTLRCLPRGQPAECYSCTVIHARHTRHNTTISHAVYSIKLEVIGLHTLLDTYMTATEPRIGTVPKSKTWSRLQWWCRWEKLCIKTASPWILRQTPRSWHLFAPFNPKTFCQLSTLCAWSVNTCFDFDHLSPLEMFFLTTHMNIWTYEHIMNVVALRRCDNDYVRSTKFHSTVDNWLLWWSIWLRSKCCIVSN